MTIFRLTPLLAGLAMFVIVGSTLGGCASTPKDTPPAERRLLLVVPPDLTVPKSDAELIVPDAVTTQPTTYSSYTEGTPVAGPGVPLLPETSGMRIERSGTQRWLVVTGPPDKIWLALRAFFQKHSFPLANDNPQTGILETEWVANLIEHKSLGADIHGVRDKLRVRMERTALANSSEIYVSYRGVAQIGSGENSGWQVRAPDPEIEAEMLRRIMLFLGATERQGQELLATARGKDDGKEGVGSKLHAELVDYSRGLSVVRLSGDMDSAWRQVGFTLDRAGFVVEDRDRSKGIYYVRATDALKEAVRAEKGFFARFSRGQEKKVDDRYQISLKALAGAGKDAATEVEVLDAQGKADNSAVGKRIVERLFEQLK